MGSDLYISIDIHDADDTRVPKHWRPLWEGPSTWMARGIVVDAFGTGEGNVAADSEARGYLHHKQVAAMAEHPECPWRLDEPYWVRCLDGAEFVAIVHEKRWQRIQRAPDGTFDFADKECAPELRAMAALVAALRAEGLGVRVWCWHSQ